MSDAWGPRRVEDGAIKRWAREAAALIVHAPLPFGCLIVAFCTLSMGLSAVLPAKINPVFEVVFYALGLVFAPLGVLIARMVDHQQTWRDGLGQLADRMALVGYELVGCVIAFTVLTAFNAGLTEPFETSMDNIVENLWFGYILTLISSQCMGLPVALLAPEMSTTEVTRQAESGLAKNGFRIWHSHLSVFVVFIFGAFIFPVFGLVNAAIMVFLSTYIYVAYRDIFEGQSGNRQRQNQRDPAHLDRLKTAYDAT